jgi:GT2 family glycosyltransferase
MGSLDVKTEHQPAPARPVPQQPPVQVVILNWNGWRDTIECLESLLRSDYHNFKVVVCDNASTDGSVERMLAWARGELAAEAPGPEPVASLTRPPVPKPISLQVLTQVQVDAGDCPPQDVSLVIIRNASNRGFAAGNNVGLRYVQQHTNAEIVWLLNNDTVVPRDAIRKTIECWARRHDAGMFAAKLLYYEHPDRVQALGGSKFNAWTCRAQNIGSGTSADSACDRLDVERQMSYPVGASMFVTRKFLEEVGLMSETYFLFFEEIDWVVRSQGRFRLAYCPETVVYHKGGASIGTAQRAADQSTIAEFYGTRNRIRFTRRFFPGKLPFVLLAVTASLFSRLLRGRWKNAVVLLRACASEFTEPVVRETIARNGAQDLR